MLHVEVIIVYPREDISSCGYVGKRSDRMSITTGRSSNW